MTKAETPLFHLQLGECVRLWEARGFSRTELAKRIGRSVGSISHWINDRRPINIESSRKLFQAFAEVFDAERERSSLIRLADAYSMKFPTRSMDEIHSIIDLPSAKDRGRKISREEAVHSNIASPRITGNGAPFFALAILLAVVIWSEQAGRGALYIWGQIWVDGRLDPFGFIIWALLLSTVFFFSLGFSGSGARKRAEWIEKGTWKESYVVVVSSFLDKIDSLLLPRNKADSVSVTSFSRNWSVQLYEKNLALAILYPIFFLMAQWLVTGSEQSLGFFKAWPEDAILARRVFICSCFVGSIALAYYARQRARSYIRIALGCLALAINFVGYGACWNAYGGVEVGPGAVNMATVAFIFGIAFRLFDNIAVPVAAASSAGAALSFAFLPLVATAEVLTGRIGGGYADDTVRAVHTIMNHSLNLLLFFCLLKLFSCFASRDVIERNPVYGGLVYGAVSVGTAGLMFFASTQKFWAEYYLFLGLLPVLNAFFDFLSVGLTRYTLRLGLSRFGIRTLVFSILDVCVALSLFVLLVFSGLLVLELLNLAAGSVVVPVTQDELMCRVDGTFLSAAHIAVFGPVFTRPFGFPSVGLQIRLASSFRVKNAA